MIKGSEKEGMFPMYFDETLAFDSKHVLKISTPSYGKIPSLSRVVKCADDEFCLFRPDYQKSKLYIQLKNVNGKYFQSWIIPFEFFEIQPAGEKKE